MSNATKTKKWNGSKWIRPEKRARIYKRDNHSCVYCDSSIYDTADMVLTLDHVVARELGGGNEHTNLVTACKSCNSAKRDLTVKQFAQYLADQGEDSSDIARRVRNATRRKLPR
jgi:5-methylcytosine-specific restriction endonuclease McrA